MPPLARSLFRCRISRSVHSLVSQELSPLKPTEGMSHPMSVTFLGTSSGGGPTENRNCSSLVCDFFEGKNLWMVDCAEGTTRQFVLQPNRPNVPRIKISQVNKLFVTHMHADHIMGIPTLLRNALHPPRIDAPPLPSNAIQHRKPPLFQIYGPCGIRSFIRQNLKMTFTRSSDTYVVHELLKNGERVTPCNAPPDSNDPTSGSDYRDWDILHCNEIPGQDILPDEQGLWRNVTSHHYSRKSTKISVHAGPILHREPCIGYVFDETTYPRRKVVILGDTFDPSNIIPLCADPNPSLLIHEATDSIISPENDRYGKLSRRNLADIMKTTLARGHSTPMMAGEFARRVNAQKLVLNHIGSRFPAPCVDDTRPGFPRDLINDIEEKATRSWEPLYGRKAIVALDFMRVLVPEHRIVQSTPDALSPSTSNVIPTVHLPLSPHSLPFIPHSSFPTPWRRTVGTDQEANNNGSQNPTTSNNQPGSVGALSNLTDSMSIQATDGLILDRFRVDDAPGDGDGGGRVNDRRPPKRRARSRDIDGNRTRHSRNRRNAHPYSVEQRGPPGGTGRGRGTSSTTTSGGRRQRSRKPRK